MVRREARDHQPVRLTTRVAVGGLCWLSTLVFFVGQAVAQAATTMPYSLATNEISDLGVTTCGPLRVFTYHATVCSPLHGVMNGAFIATGLLSLLGIIGSYHAWPRRRLTTGGLAVLALVGVGEILAGLAPENVNPGLHVAGALLGLLGANIGLLLLGAAPSGARSGGWASSPCSAELWGWSASYSRRPPAWPPAQRSAWPAIPWSSG